MNAGNSLGGSTRNPGTISEAINDATSTNSRNGPPICLFGDAAGRPVTRPAVGKLRPLLSKLALVRVEHRP